MREGEEIKSFVGVLELSRRTGYSRQQIGRLAKAGEIPGTLPDNVHRGQPMAHRGQGYRFESSPRLDRWVAAHTKVQEDRGVVGRPRGIGVSTLNLLHVLHGDVSSAALRIETAISVAALFDPLVKIGHLGSKQFVELGRRLRSHQRRNELIRALRTASEGLAIAADSLEGA